MDVGSSNPAFYYNDADFRIQFPAFSNTTTYPQATLQNYFNIAGVYVHNSNYGFLAQDGATLYSLYLLTAHLAAIQTMIANGQTPSITINAGIDKISVGIEPPPVKGMFQYWLATTPYGQQLTALLTVQSVGGFFTPGSLGRAGFY